jgi:signal transduction histidine kinase
LSQILLNLLGNAVKYTERGEVGLEIRPTSEGAEILVWDTGIGVAPSHLKRIFEPFWQVDPSQRSHGGGTGLGLSVVRRLTQLLQGDVSVESTVGQGTTFKVRLPRRVVEEHGAS